MTSADYSRGYRAGFSDGFDAAQTDATPHQVERSHPIADAWRRVPLWLRTLVEGVVMVGAILAICALIVVGSALAGLVVGLVVWIARDVIHYLLNFDDWEHH